MGSEAWEESQEKEEEEEEPVAAAAPPSLPAQAQDTLRAPAEGHRRGRQAGGLENSRGEGGHLTPWSGPWQRRQYASLQPPWQGLAPTILVLAVKLHSGAGRAAALAFLPLIVAPRALAPLRQARRQQEHGKQKRRDGRRHEGATPHHCLLTGDPAGADREAAR